MTEMSQWPKYLSKK